MAAQNNLNYNNIKALILDGLGINCAAEMQAAYQLFGIEAKILHLGQIFNNFKRNSVDLLEFDIINFPGGFSYGDDLGAGRALANIIKYKKIYKNNSFFDYLLNYIKTDNKYILGICNGFQILLSLGLLPGLDRNFNQQAVLTINKSQKFEDRWVYCKVNNPELNKMLPKGVWQYPVRHKEGRLIVKNSEVKNLILKHDLIALQYCENNGIITDKYPLNPNQSWLSCTGLMHPNRRILGLMPHPEACVSIYNHPNWPQLIRNNNKLKYGSGFYFFQQIITLIKQHKILTKIC